jgi:sterol desaturase/sphingolipid hydroxylase (fatty acid hydroxylase superfamily)
VISRALGAVGRSLALGVAGAALAVGERAFPLRERVAPGARRILGNLAFGAGSGVVVNLLETPLAAILSRRALRRRGGLVFRLGLSGAAADAAAMLLLDYSMYLWHIATHQVPSMWKYHAAHHQDRDLDVTTAFRFHAGEMLLTLPLRAAQILLIGVSPRAYALWKTAFFASVLFHHSNLRLPARLERGLAWFIMTPRLHGIHHSVVETERNSNWSSGLTLWDRLHGTLLTGTAQRDLVIGLRTEDQAAVLQTSAPAA